MGVHNAQIGQSVEAKWLREIVKYLDLQRKSSTIADPKLLAKIDELISATTQVEITADSINLNTDELESLAEAGNLLLEEIKTNLSNSFDGQLIQDGNPVSNTNPLPVSGPITDDQLRASAILVSATSLPLPTGAATEVKQDNEISEIQNVVKNTSAFYTEDVEEDTSNNTTFVGKQTNAGVWLLQKIVEATIGTKTTTTMEYASVLNNATKTTYASAWTDRATLTYSEIKNLL